MEYEIGKALEQINEKLDAVLVKLYPEAVEDKIEKKKKKEVEE